jgi:hypothetical protein
MRWSQLHGDMQGRRLYKEGAVPSELSIEAHGEDASAKFLVG